MKCILEISEFRSYYYVRYLEQKPQPRQRFAGVRKRLFYKYPNKRELLTQTLNDAWILDLLGAFLAKS